jgi:hypothetical protein
VPPYGGLDLERPIDCRKRVPGTGEDLTQYLPEELRPTRDDTLPERIIHLLATFGPDAKDALPELQAGLEDPLTGVRREAARAIEAITKRRER